MQRSGLDVGVLHAATTQSTFVYMFTYIHTKYLSLIHICKKGAELGKQGESQELCSVWGIGTTSTGLPGFNGIITYFNIISIESNRALGMTCSLCCIRHQQYTQVPL